jgi:plastocyanin
MRFSVFAALAAVPAVVLAQVLRSDNPNLERWLTGFALQQKNITILVGDQGAITYNPPSVTANVGDIIIFEL